jgi:hypothetical protein
MINMIPIFGRGDSGSPRSFCKKSEWGKGGQSPTFGEMAEWTKARDSKSRIPQGVGGSNPSLSATSQYFSRRITLFNVGGFPFLSFFPMIL